MTRKNRFPLLMEDGVEVRSVEELRNHFSVSRVIDYLQDGLLGEWLLDRYEDEMAELVKEIDPKSDDVIQKVCDVFDVPFLDESEVMEEIERERKRKMTLLESYPNCEQYRDEVDFIAFNQDDLLNLLDDNVSVIYLCGERFSVPTSKTNIRYVGISDNVTVCINSKNVIDFSEKSITFKNCSFDEKYAKLLRSNNSSDDTVLKHEVTKTYNRNDILRNHKAERDRFIKSISETVGDFYMETYENENDERYRYDHPLNYDPDKYGNCDRFPTRAKAKTACRKVAERAIYDIREQYIEAKKQLIEDTDKYYDGMRKRIVEYFSLFCESYNDLCDLYCSPHVKPYFAAKLSDFKSSINWKDDTIKKCDCVRSDILKEHFLFAEQDFFDIDSLFELCEFEEDNGSFLFDVNNVCCELIDKINILMSKEEYAFPKSVEEAYEAIKAEKIRILECFIKEL